MANTIKVPDLKPGDYIRVKRFNDTFFKTLSVRTSLVVQVRFVVREPSPHFRGYPWRVVVQVVGSDQTLTARFAGWNTLLRAAS